MRYLSLLLLLTLAFLSTACDQRQSAPPPPPPTILTPPADGVAVFEYQHSNGNVVAWTRPEAQGIEVSQYIESLDGQHRAQWWGIAPYSNREHMAAYIPAKSMYGNEGVIVQYGIDSTPDKRYGGRRFIWKTRYRWHTQEEPWRLELPVGPVSFEILERFPWEAPGQTLNPRTPEGRGIANTTPIIAPFLGCFQADRGPFREKGLYAFNPHATAFQWFEEPIAQPGLASMTHQWSWSDGKADGYIADTQGGSGMFLTDGRRPPRKLIPTITNRLHTVVVIAYADGIGPFPRSWEKRYWRLAGRGFGAFENPDGSVRCEFGEWKLEELTDPEGIYLMDGWRTRRDGWSFPPTGAPIPPVLDVQWP